MTSNLLVPGCSINGHPVSTSYGTQDLTVWAGPNHVALAAQWMRTYGQASLDVNVAPGQVVEVFYAAPLHQFTTGSIGLTKQSRKGQGFMFGCVVFPLVAFLAAMIWLTLR